MLKKEKIDLTRLCLTICDFDIGVKRRGLIETTGIG